MNLEETKEVFFIGIGGIGMSALARYFKHLGLPVYGYDRTSTVLTKALEREGITVFYEDRTDLIPHAFRNFDEVNLLIYTPAVPADLTLLKALRETGYRALKRAEVLGLISRNSYTIAVAGTHGKTTTSTLIAHVLLSNGLECAAFLGGISSNYHTNTLFKGEGNRLMVVEADEFDRSFLHLHPDIAVVTSTDADHLDIYGDLDHVQESFRLFVDQVNAQGLRIIRKGLHLPGDRSYAAGEVADCYADQIRVQEGSFWFSYKSQGVEIDDIRLEVPGLHNVENAVAAITACLKLGVSPSAVKESIASFRGVKRRFEYQVRNEEQVYIDDYAHHPVELKACIQAAKALYPERQLTMVFQPHLFSRTRDFAPEFAEALAMADELILLDIYPAREKPIEGITSDWLLNKVPLKRKMRLSAQELLHYVEEDRPALLITAGAGDIDLLVEPLKQIMTHG